MKAEKSDGPVLNLLHNEGVQTQDAEITQILLSDGTWYAIEPGSFHIYSPSDNPKAIPYIQFDTATVGADGRKIRIQVFPATVAGWAFPVEQEAADEGIAQVPPPERIG